MSSTYFSDTGDAVGDEGFESGDCACLLISTVPHLNSNVESLHLGGGNLHNSDVDRLVGEIFDDLTSWALNCDFSSLHCHFDCSPNIGQKLKRIFTYRRLGSSNSLL